MSNATYTGIIGKRALVSYVDPHPALKGNDRVFVECGMCVNGVYQGHSGLTWKVRGIETKWCFRCNGSNRRSVTVSSVRREARAAAYAVDFADEIAAARELENWLRAEAYFIAEQERAAAAAAKEAARVASLVQGFIAEVGEKVAGIEITVKVAHYNAGSYNRSSTMFIIAETAEGNVIKFSGSARSVMNLEKGDVVTITTGKVKAHEEYNAQEQSVLSHVKVTAPVAQEEEDDEVA